MATGTRRSQSRGLFIWAFYISPLMLLLLASYFVPLLGVFSWSVTEPEFGFSQYLRVMTDPGIHSILLRTLRICTLTAVFSVLLAYLLAYHWVYGPPLRRKIIAFAVLVPFWISVLIRAFGWLALLRPQGIINSTLTGAGLISDPLPLVRNELGVIIGMVHFMTPFAVFPLISVMRQVDMRILQAASGLGARAFRRFFEIFLPLTLPGIIGAFFIVFVFALGFFITPAILGGGRVVMVAEYIYTQMSQTANWGLGAALATTLLGFVLLMTWIVSRFVDFERLAK